MAGVYQRLLGLFLLDGGWLIRHEAAIDDLLLHKTLAEDAQILESLFGRAALGQRLIDLLAGCFQFGLMVLEARRMNGLAGLSEVPSSLYAATSARDVPSS